MRGRKGGAAVLLMLLLSSVLGITAILFHGACSASSRSMSEGCLDLAGRSALSQYHRGLWKDYGLFALKADDERIASDVTYYVAASFPVLGSNSASGVGRSKEKGQGRLSLCRIALSDVSADSGEFSLLIPEMAELQILSYMKYRALFLGADQLVNRETELKTALEENASAKDLESGRQQAAAEAEQRQAEADESVEEETDEEKKERKKRQQAIWRLKDRIKELNPEELTQAPGEASEQVLRNHREREQLPSHLTDWNGIPDLAGLYSGDQLLAEVRNNVYINEYILTHFSHCLTETEPEISRFFHNEIEYILWGNESDQRNLKRTKAMLFTMRTTLNLAHIYGDPDKRAITLQAAIAIAPGPAATAVQFLIASLWAGAESTNDLKILYGGGKVPFVKRDADWKLGLEEILNQVPASIETEEGREQSYQDYLRFFLALQNRQTRILRMLDVIQLNVRLKWDGAFFVKDYCAGFAVKACFTRQIGIFSPFSRSGEYTVEKVQRY